MFQDREQAGKELAVKLQDYKKTKNLIVLAVPRGGVVVGKQLAKSLNCPLDILVTKKIGSPGNPELAIGAIGPNGTVVLNRKLAPKTGANDDYLKNQKVKIKKDLDRQQKRLRGKKRHPDLKKKTVILTDDGIATGATVEAAIKWIKTQKPKKLILAIPVAAPDSVAKLTPLVDKLIWLDQPYFFAAVGQFYQSFPQVSDEEVIQLLEER